MWEEPGSASLSSARPSSITEHTSSQLVGSSAIALDRTLVVLRVEQRQGRQAQRLRCAGGRGTAHGILTDCELRFSFSVLSEILQRS